MPASFEALRQYTQRAADTRPAATGNLLAHAVALAATTASFRDLLALLNRRLHVVPALLQLAQKSLSCKLALKVFDGSLHTLAVNDDLKGLALNCFARVTQGTGKLANLIRICKRKIRDADDFLRGCDEFGPRHDAPHWTTLQPTQSEFVC